MSRNRLAGTALALALVLAGCGDGGGGGLSERAADRLQDQVAAVQYAAAGGAYGPAREGLDQLRSTTTRLVERGEVDPFRADRIFDEIERVDAVLDQLEAG